MDIIKKTKSVKKILNTFNKTDAISIIELVDKFKKEMNKTTVYRVLERLEKSNILHSFIDQKGLKRYAKNNKNTSSTKSHPHFMCEDCGESSCVDIDIKIPSTPQYIIKNSEYLLTGQCKKCLA
tara:strand:+ start:242 stop:613 length:372 start_codon:yes stop_codon:yes gene_type:complete